jgi:hypothetical protein
MPARMGPGRFVRIVGVLAALAYGGWYAYDELFKPGEVRRRVTEELTARFEGVDVEVGSARMRPFLGGVNVSDLKLIRRDDPTRTPFLHVPHAVIWLDKADLSRRFSAGKIEFDDARLRLIRDPTGKWNVEGITKPTAGGDQAPILILKKARVEVIDLRTGTAAVLDLQEMDLTVINDPANVFTFEAKGKSTPVGPFHARGRFESGVGASGTLDLNGIVLGPDLARLIGMFAPEALDHLATITGTATCRTRWTWKPGRQPVVAYDTELELTGARCSNPLLPAPIENLHLKARCKDGDLTVEDLSGKVGESGVCVKLEIDAPPTQPGAPVVLVSPDNIEERLRHLEVTVTDLVVGPDLFERLPPKLTQVRELFAPSGTADVTYERHRDQTGVRKRCVFRPKGMAAKYCGFPYPVDRIRGTIDATLDDVASRYEVDLVGEGNGKPVSLKGRVIGGADRQVDLVLTGSDISLDKALIDALPDEYPDLVRRLRPTATGDFTAKIRHNARVRRDHGPDAFDNEFDIKVRSGTLSYVDFPYALRNLAGNLIVRTVPHTPTIAPPDAGTPAAPACAEVGTVAIKDFTATGSGGCKLRINGSFGPEPGGDVLALDVRGEGVPLDGELFKAIARLKLDSSWSTFDPSGRMNCEIRVRIHNRYAPPSRPDQPFQPSRDLELGLSFNGPSLRPTFFPYQLTEAAGQVSYARGRVEMHQFRARHGATAITLPSAEVLLPPAGGYWADLYDLRVNPVVVDREFLAALPRGLKSACLGLDPRGPMAIHARRLVISDPPPGQPPVRAVPEVASAAHLTARATMSAPPRETLPTIYWDATVVFKDAAVHTGVSWDSLAGHLTTRGLYVGDRLGRVVGDLVVDKGRVMKQPVQAVSARFEVDPARPDVIAIPWINGRVYGGEVGGQARLEIGTPVRFDLALNASRLKLEEFSKANNLGAKTELEGLATAQLNLSNPPDPVTRLPVLEGSGSIDVPSGRMLDLPVMLDVIKLARLRPMDHTAFEEAHAVFRIRGDRLKVGQLDLLGNAVSLGGEGEMDLDGRNSRFEFYTVWTNIRNMLGGSGDVTARLSSSLYRIRVAGDLGGDKPPKVSQEPLPMITEPIRRLLGRAAK